MKTPHAAQVWAVVLACALPSRAGLMPSFLRFGVCSDVEQQPDFDMEQFTGLWYGILRVPNEYSPIKRCITSHYSSVDENGRFMNSRGGVADNDTEIHSELELMIMDDELYSYAMPAKDSRPQVGITVAKTDYTNFACFYSCIQRFTFKAEFVGVMSRTPSVKKAHVEECKTIITEQSSFDWSHLSMVEQGESCPYWPDHVEKMKQRQLEDEKVRKEMADAMDEAVLSAIEEDMKDTEDLEDLLYFDTSSSTPVHAALDFRILFCALIFLFS